MASTVETPRNAGPGSALSTVKMCFGVRLFRIMGNDMRCAKKVFWFWDPKTTGKIHNELSLFSLKACGARGHCYKLSGYGFREGLEMLRLSYGLHSFVLQLEIEDAAP